MVFSIVSLRGGSVCVGRATKGKTAAALFICKTTKVRLELPEGGTAERHGIQKSDSVKQDQNGESAGG